MTMKWCVGWTLLFLRVLRFFPHNALSMAASKAGSPKDSPQWYGDSLQLTTVPLAPSVRSKLQQAGFVSVRDVKGTRGPINLAREAGLTNAEASDVLKTLRFGIQGTSLAGARSASEILYEENCKLAIFTFSKDLDDLLGGGIAVGEITELCGCPGIGKTQACIQLCVSVQMPKAFGGYEGSAVYIDTEGSFMAERAREMARATVGHLFSISRFLPKQPSGSDPLAQFTEEAILDRFHLFRCHEITELLAVVESLPTYVKAHGVKLVVIDSIAFHFRQDFKDMALRTAILAKMTSQLLNLAKSEQLAVVSVNQVTVKPDLASGVARLVPALGESYAHGCTTRVILRWERDVRMAYLYKSPRLPRGKARFTVTNGGLRDVRGKKRQAE
mmetsp:Transcript_9563/g.43549  ORF Transcript_9563/g.43549 Transcript_9563/m.43549 type:complete len:387 (+) Transcript_9563:63-1223(+)